MQDAELKKLRHDVDQIRKDLDTILVVLSLHGRPEDVMRKVFERLEELEQRVGIGRK